MSQYDTIIRQHFDVQGSSGEEVLCRCPWHDDRGKPNLYINAKHGMYLCHACGAKGHLKNVLKNLPAPSTTDLREKIAAVKKDDKAGVGRIYTEDWLNRFDFEHEYWTSRGISDEMIAKFQLGYDPVMDRVTIPLRTVEGKLLGVVQRVLNDDKPKYRYPRGFPVGRHLFGQWLVKGRKKVALVEGSLDAIACWEARVPAMALLGSRLTEAQRQVLQRTGVKTVAIFTDNDKAGKEAVWQVHEALLHSGVSVQVCQYRPYWTAKDPGELQPQQRRKAYHSAVPWHRWNVNRERATA